MGQISLIGLIGLIRQIGHRRLEAGHQRWMSRRPTPKAGHRTPEAGHREGTDAGRARGWTPKVDEPEGPESQRLDTEGWMSRGPEGPDTGRAGGWTPGGWGL